MNIEVLILFFLSTIGMCHIIVDSSIMQWFRDFVRATAVKLKIPDYASVIDCYLCCGTWCGFFMGMVWISCNPFKVLACGFIGGFLSNFAITVINWIESQTYFRDVNTEEKNGN